METDLDGRPRIMDGDLDGQAGVDMGACEFGEVVYVAPHGSENPCNGRIPCYSSIQGRS